MTSVQSYCPSNTQLCIQNSVPENTENSPLSGDVNRFRPRLATISPGFSL